MPTLDPEELESLHKAYQKAYAIGLVICVVWPLFLQLLLGPVIRPGQNAPAGVYQELGYTFTLLVVASAAFVTWRSGVVRKGFPAMASSQRPRILFREVLLYSALFELSSLWGLLYWMMVGQDSKHPHARAFILLSSLMFFFFVPRFPAWKDAAEGN